MWRVRVKVVGTQNIVYLRSSIFFSISASSLKQRIKELMRGKRGQRTLVRTKLSAYNKVSSG